jgi:hypothetical protein
MRSLAKTLLALALGLGFLALEVRAKTSVAFLGIDPDTDPLFGRALSSLIHQELAADTALASLPPKAVADFLVKASIDNPVAHPTDVARLKPGLEARYYAYGRLEALNVENKRVWWMPWSVRTKWSRALRLRVLDGSTGDVVFDAQVPAVIPEQHFISGPDGNHSRISALERDSRYRRMLPFLSSETAKALAKAIMENGQAPAAGTEDAAGAAAEPAPGR